MNKGEFAETRFIATIGCYRNKFIEQIDNQKIESLQIPNKNGLTEIPPFEDFITPEYIANLTPEKLNAFFKEKKITKAGTYSKADIYINGIGYSIKYTDSAPPAIVNHTNRTGWQFAAEEMNTKIEPLDEIIAEYWQKRLSNLIKEDVSNNDVNSPFKNKIEILRPFLEYYSFHGTGSKRSAHPAEAIIKFSDPQNIGSYQLIKKTEFIDQIWDRLVFSVRSKKGMPSNINSPNLDPNKKSSILKWSNTIDGNLKGALHVRIR